MTRTVTELDIRTWAEARADETLRDGLTSYLPRFGNRGADEVVRHPSLHVCVPQQVARELRHRLYKELRDAGIGIGDYRFLDTNHWHATYAWMKPGENEVEDEARINIAREAKPQLIEVARQLPQSVFTINGIVILGKQIMFTYDADTWNAAFAGMQLVREHLPRFAEGGYSLDKPPIEGGQILQSTAAMFVGGDQWDIAAGEARNAEPLVSALRHWLPGGDFEPISFASDALSIVIHRFSPDAVLQREAFLARGQLRPVPGIDEVVRNLNAPPFGLL